MHRSQLAGLIIDCQTDNLETAAGFWSEALGLPEAASDDGGKYVALETDPNAPYVEVQQVAHASRVHIDIEADDIEAEAQRLEALGARRLGAVRSWIVMEAPTGQRFCIVEPQSADFAEQANCWGDER